MSTDTITEVRPYLTFRIDEEVFAVDVHQVREILDDTKVTRIPQMPEFMLGVISIRGSAVPIIDMRLKFGLEKIEPTVDTAIVVLEVDDNGSEVTVGALVDGVNEVFEVEPEEVEPPPRMGSKLNADFLKGMGRKDDRFFMILDVNRTFTSDEIDFVKTASDVKSDSSAGNNEETNNKKGGQ